MSRNTSDKTVSPVTECNTSGTCMCIANPNYC